VQTAGRSGKAEAETINVDGGMLAWTGAGRAVVTDDGSAGTV